MNRWIPIRRLLSVVCLLAGILSFSIGPLDAQVSSAAAASAASRAQDHNQRGIALARREIMPPPRTNFARQ